MEGRQLKRRLSREAEMASLWLWGRREVQWEETVRDSCACKIRTQADRRMVPGWELITPVGAPLEVVVDSAKTTEREGST